jgi:RHS repeat-associated protein
LPGSNPVTWKESYTYDSAARPSTIATTIKEGAAVALNSAMSYDSSGRPDTHTYPDGLVVRTLYGPYGQSGGQADGSAGTIWYEITAMDAWGKPTTEQYADGTVGTFADYQSSGQQHTASWTLNGNTVDSLTYAYDSLGNLVSQYRVAGSQSNTETYLYDQLQRLTNASRTGGSVSYGYSASGNLTSKSDFGSYGYAGANSHNGNCGPHATYAAGGFTYACDANGNVYGGSTLSIAYDADNHPRTATRNGATDTWAYDANGQRDYESTTRGIRYFGPGGYEQVGTQGIHELGPIVVTRTNGANTVTTTLRDRLGSTIDTIDAGVANSANTRTYDAFGAVREGNMANRAGGTLNLNDTIHGFTKHEHADDVQLIHMGGRIYDYQLGRFLSVDPIIGNPLSSQSLNPYSYIGNNPLGGTDPTGYAACLSTDSPSCLEGGVNTMKDVKTGKSTTIIVANASDNVAFTGQMNVSNFKYISNSINVAYNPSNGADNWIKNGPNGSHDPDRIGTITDNNKGCAGGIQCYNVHSNGKGVDSFERTFSVTSSYGAINGITNEVGRAMQLMAEHVSSRFGSDSFMLAHNPTEGFWRDIFETAQDKLGFTTTISQHFGEVLAGVDHPMSWVAHSQGGEIFAEGARYALNHGAGSLSNNTVAFDSGANNAWATNRILARGGIQLYRKGYFDAKNDAVPQVFGLRGFGHPINMFRSIIDFPKLFGPDSPHTHPQPNE